MEGRLGSFNVSLPAEAMSTYGARESGRGDYWAAFAAMATDITDICPMMVSPNILAKSLCLL